MTPIVSATILRTQSDARLVTLVRQGYERAFEAIVERYRRPLQRYCRRMLSDSRSEDAVQQTFLKAWSALQAGEEVKDLKPWLYRIARNNSLDALKKAGYDYDELSDSLRATGTLTEDVERRAVMRQTLTGLAALPIRQRDVLLGLAVEGKSRAQVAAELGITDGAVRQLAHRARLAMRAAATAVTPLPFVSWSAAIARHDDHVRERIAELAAGGGAAGVTGVLVKGGAVIVAAGVIATAPNAIYSGSATKDPSAAQAAQRNGGGRDDHAHGFAGSSAGALRDALDRTDHTTATARASGPSATASQPADDHLSTSTDDHGGSSSDGGPVSGDHSGSGSGSSDSGSGGGDDRSGSSGSGTSGTSGSGTSGSGTSDGGMSDGGSSGSTSSGSGSSSVGTSDSGDGVSGGGDVLFDSSGSGSGRDSISSGPDLRSGN
jgi:RNA polymerase sigma factor (sigma-70 family)